MHLPEGTEIVQVERLRSARGGEARQFAETSGAAALLTMTQTSCDDCTQVVECATRLYAASRHLTSTC